MKIELPRHCPFRCHSCGRRCRAAQPLNHRFDCCGRICAHIVDQGRWLDMENPMFAGYLTGLSQTGHEG